MLDEKFDSDQTSSNMIGAHPTHFFLLFTFFALVQTDIKHFIQHVKCWMKCWIGLHLAQDLVCVFISLII